MIVRKPVFYICCLVFSIAAVNFQTANAASGGYEQPKRGYSYQKPKPPPIAESTPEEQDPNFEDDRFPTGVSPSKEAEFPTRPPALGLETEKEIDSQAIMPDAFPPKVNDQPDFELPDDRAPCTASMNCIYGDTIPGVEGVDYPIYATVPKTNFKCPSLSGYYGDAEARCQPFHVCLNMRGKVRQYSFLCPNGTIFSQMDFVCVWWHDFNCDATPSLYNLNKQLRWDDPTVTFQQKMENIMKMAKINSAGGSPIPKSNFPQQLLPALSIRLPNTKQNFGLLQSTQSLQVSRAATSKTRTKSSQFVSESEAYENKDASGFIVNRGPVSKGSPAYFPTTTLEPFYDTETPRTVNLVEEEPRATYLPPRDASTPPPRTYLPPNTSQMRLPPLAEPSNEFNPPQESEEDTLPNVRPVIEYDTTTISPITQPPPQYLPPTAAAAPPPRVAPPPPPRVAAPPPPRVAPPPPPRVAPPPPKVSKQKLNYLPPKPYREPDSGYAYNPSFNDNDFAQIRKPQVASAPPRSSASRDYIPQTQYDPVALFLPKTSPTFKQVKNVQKNILQHGAGPTAALQPNPPLTFSLAGGPNLASSSNFPSRQSQESLKYLPPQPVRQPGRKQSAPRLPLAPNQSGQAPVFVNEATEMEQLPEYVDQNPNGENPIIQNEQPDFRPRTNEEEGTREQELESMLKQPELQPIIQRALAKLLAREIQVRLIPDSVAEPNQGGYSYPAQPQIQQSVQPLREQPQIQQPQPVRSSGGYQNFQPQIQQALQPLQAQPQIQQPAQPADAPSGYSYSQPQIQQAFQPVRAKPQFQQALQPAQAQPQIQQPAQAQPQIQQPVQPADAPSGYSYSKPQIQQALQPARAQPQFQQSDPVNAQGGYPTQQPQYVAQIPNTQSSPQIQQSLQPQIQQSLQPQIQQYLQPVRAQPQFQQKPQPSSELISSLETPVQSISLQPRPTIYNQPLRNFAFGSPSFIPGPTRVSGRNVINLSISQQSRRPHLPVVYEKFKEPYPTSTKDRSQFDIPEQVRHLLIPEVQGSIELVKSRNVFAKTYIDQNEGEDEKEVEVFPETNAAKPLPRPEFSPFRVRQRGRKLPRLRQIIRLPTAHQRRRQPHRKFRA